ncbi:MAG: hypothetical protein LUF26_07960 [Firmicutes bacterium]|nr:hypothetical protein [Bacillota bacterium]
MEKIIFLLIVIICTIRIVNYGIYTVKDGNKTGGAGLFVMAFFAALTSVCAFIK